jgi:thiamine biosynthesis lipoprotein
MSPVREASHSFKCFGSVCSVHVIGPDGTTAQTEAVACARRQLLAWHDRFTRFGPDSELSRLNADARTEVPVSAVMARFLKAGIRAVEMTGGLVDATQLDQLEAAGYTRDLRPSLPLELALAAAPPRRSAASRLESRWNEVSVDLAGRMVSRPPGMRFDSGGIAKGLFADLLGQELARQKSFAIDCAGDLRLGGTGTMPRPVHVASPFDQRVLQSFELAGGGIATSGIGKRSWLDSSGRPAHHLLDPATGRPAFTGVVQATALAPTALDAELRAKAAVLSGPEGAGPWLCHGGVLVFDDGTHEVVAHSDGAFPGSSVISRPPRPRVRKLKIQRTSTRIRFSKPIK